MMKLLLLLTLAVVSTWAAKSCQYECLVEWMHNVMECRQLPPIQRDPCLQHAALVEAVCIGGCPPATNISALSRPPNDGCDPCCHGQCSYWPNYPCCCETGFGGCVYGGCYPVQCACGCSSGDRHLIQFYDQRFGIQTFEVAKNGTRVVCQSRSIVFGSRVSTGIDDHDEMVIPGGVCRTLDDESLDRLLRQKDIKGFNVFSMTTPS